MKALKVSVLIIAAIVLGACRTAPIYNVKNAPVVMGSAKHATMPEVRRAIMDAGLGLGWKMQVVSPGHIIASLAIRDHLAVVDITYNAKTYSITYKDSRNLKYGFQNNRSYTGYVIHKNYNGWIHNLDTHIRNILYAK